ncbi:MAG: serine protease [Thalassobaculaceae bacterium]
MRLGKDSLGLLGVLVVAVVAVTSTLMESGVPARDGGDTSARRPAPSAPPVSVEVPDLRGALEFSISIGDRRDGSGTAFAIADGVWMTARHVVDGCDVVGVLERPGRGVRARSFSVHRNADVAVMRMDRSGPSVALSDTVPRRGDIAYHVGFPRGEPGELRSRMLGISVMNVGGRYSTREPVIAWAELDRYPEDSSPLSGLSGGPVFDAAGRLIGVHVAGSVRRGRSFTAHPSSIRQLLDRAGVAVAARDPSFGFTSGTLPEVADDLRARRTVVKALCDVR